MADILTMLASAEDGYAAPSALFLEDYQWVSLAMAVLIGVFIWKKVPGLIVGGLDAKILLNVLRDTLKAAQIRSTDVKNIPHFGRVAA